MTWRVVAGIVGVVVLSGLMVSLRAQSSSATSAQVVRVTAERFTFTPAAISVAPGTEIEFHLSSEDTSHGFRILGQSVDVAIPKRGRGRVTVKFTPTEPGTYVFECSRMCGAGHSFMRGTIKVKGPNDREQQ